MQGGALATLGDADARPVFFCGRCRAWLPDVRFCAAQLARREIEARRCLACEAKALDELDAAMYRLIDDGLIKGGLSAAELESPEPTRRFGSSHRAFPPG